MTFGTPIPVLETPEEEEVRVLNNLCTARLEAMIRQSLAYRMERVGESFDTERIALKRQIRHTIGSSPAGNRAGFLLFLFRNTFGLVFADLLEDVPV